MKSPIPAEELAKSRGDNGSGAALTLPPGTFTSPEFFDFELDAVWNREWFCLGRANDLGKKGDYFTVTVGREPLVVVRTGGEDVAVLSAVCQHRGMILAEGTGNVRRFRCPYHDWTYALDGKLITAPDMTDAPYFDPESVCLPRLRSEVWEGFIFATFDPEIPSIAERLQGLSVKLASYRISELRAPEPLSMEAYDWNWKLYGDECYHCSHLHSQSWNDKYPTPAEAVDTDSSFNDPENGIVAYEILGELDGSPTRTGMRVHPALPGLSDAERSKLVYVTVAPNLLIVGMPDKVKYFLWLPTGATGSLFGVSWCFPESTMAEEGFRERWLTERDDLAPVMKEDIWAWSGSQRGMFSRFAPRSQFAPSESVLVNLNDWLVERYLRADREAATVS